MARQHGLWRHCAICSRKSPLQDFVRPRVLWREDIALERARLTQAVSHMSSLPRSMYYPIVIISDVKRRRKKKTMIEGAKDSEGEAKGQDTEKMAGANLRSALEKERTTSMSLRRKVQRLRRRLAAAGIAEEDGEEEGGGEGDREGEESDEEQRLKRASGTRLKGE